MLLNRYYKINSKIINNRPTSVLYSLSGNEQNGLIKGRYISHSIRLLFDFIDYTDHNHDPGTLLSLDMCKTFDSLKWDFIFKVFESFGFGNYLNDWLKTIYKFLKCIISNNFLSRFFEVSKSVCQSDPLLPTIMYAMLSKCFQTRSDF